MVSLSPRLRGNQSEGKLSPVARHHLPRYSIAMREHFRVVWSAAQEAAARGYWKEARPISADVNEHIATLLGVLVGGDGKLVDQELALFNDLFAEVLGGRQTNPVLRALLNERAHSNEELTARPPAFFEAILRMDAASRTTTARAVMLSLQEIGREAAALDGDIARTELTTLTDYILMLRQAVPSKQVAEQAGSAQAPTETLETLLAKLHRLVGLKEVKERVETLVNTIRVRQLRQQHGLPVPPVSLHMVFTGNPGTGKTTVARLMAGIFRALGVVEKGQLVEVDRTGLVAGYVGQTALKVHERVEAALGGVLFIDEAYALVAGRGDNDFGYEALDVLVKAMEDQRDDFIVIVAGYPDKMREFIDSNPGLTSRFANFVEFEDYDADELLLILERMVEDHGYTLSDATRARARQLFTEMVEGKSATFANARDVRNIFERALAKHANRLAKVPQPTKAELMSLEPDDLAHPDSIRK
jgi:Cdc6-like AAA superfamily ATPase